MFIFTDFSATWQDRAQSCYWLDHVAFIHLLPTGYVTQNKPQNSMSYIFTWEIQAHSVLNVNGCGEDQIVSLVKRTQHIRNVQ